MESISLKRILLFLFQTGSIKRYEEQRGRGGVNFVSIPNWFD